MWTESNSTFEEAPVGAHAAKLIQLIDIGTQIGEYEGKETKRRQNIFVWELPLKLRDDGKPFTINKYYTASIGETSNLYKDLTSWFGKSPTTIKDKKGKVIGLDPEPKSLLGQGCQVVVIEKAKTGKHAVSTVVGLPEGMELPEGTHNPLVFFNLDDFDEEVFAALPAGIQRMIERSPEYQEAVSGVSAADTPPDEDIPF